MRMPSQTVLLWTFLAALALSRQPVPAFATNQPPPKDAATAPKLDPMAHCYPARLRPAVKTRVSSLPPPGLCLGSQVKQGGVAYCVSCGTSGTAVSGGCVSCNPGYAWSARRRQCCQAAGTAPPQPK
jgi:hypothetical protein